VQSLDRDEVSLLIQAPAEDIYALVADVTRTPEFSPALVRCTWLDGATGPAVGARFEAVNTTETGKTWKNRPVVTAAVRGCEFAFSRTEPLAGTLLWRYRFEPVDDGTLVTESYEVTRPITRLGWFVIERIFKAGDVRAGLRAGMRTTLERLQRTAERESAAPSRNQAERRGAVSPADVLRRYFEAQSGADVEDAMQLVADDAVFDVGRGRYEGPGIREFLERLRSVHSVVRVIRIDDAGPGRAVAVLEQSDDDLLPLGIASVRLDVEVQVATDGRIALFRARPTPESLAALAAARESGRTSEGIRLAEDAGTLPPGSREL
jgi:hypothetical protein